MRSAFDPCVLSEIRKSWNRFQDSRNLTLESCDIRKIEPHMGVVKKLSKKTSRYV